MELVNPFVLLTVVKTQAKTTNGEFTVPPIGTGLGRYLSMENAGD